MGQQGPLPITQSESHYLADMYLINASRELGIEFNPNYNSGSMLGMNSESIYHHFLSALIDQYLESIIYSQALPILSQHPGMGYVSTQPPPTLDLPLIGVISTYY